MEEKDQLDDFLDGTLSEEEEKALRKEIEQSEELSNRLAEKSLERMVVEEMDRRFWLDELKNIDETDTQTIDIKPINNNKTRIRRLFFISSIAASILLLVWFVWPFSPGSPDLLIADNWRQADYNIKEFPAALPSSAGLRGTWETSIRESDHSSLQLRMQCLDSERFLLTAILFTKNNAAEGDKINATGTYSIEGSKLRLALQTESIKSDASADPFNAAAIEQWLKTRRLFSDQLEVVRLDEEQLILRYSASEGLIWNRVK